MKWITPKVETELCEVDIEHMNLLGDWLWNGQTAPWCGQLGSPWSGQGTNWKGQS